MPNEPCDDHRGDPDDDGLCPVCGQPYAHKRELPPEMIRKARGGEPRLRDDATECRTRPLVGARTVYVHFPGDHDQPKSTDHD